MNRILHTMLRVSNLEKSIEFYTKILGMNVLRTVEQLDQGFSLTFLGYAKESETCVLELNYIPVIIQNARFRALEKI
ncbi:VOC family protein [Colwellia psychrerythraea]|uniref:VOC family protein n=1 Tax=Colwellia psychrerythraea TaxID=28229 RepID=UPI0009D675D9|nr:VOC family protein [Colwellia psychrerythraea]